MATGDSNDILSRVRKLLPRRWFAWAAPLRDAVIGGLSDEAAWCYDFYSYAKQQTRLATMTGPWLDLFSYDFLARTLSRGNLPDDQYRTLIQATILQPRVTRQAMSDILTKVVGTTPWIFEPWNTNDTGAYGVGTMGYGVGRGGYGNMKVPGIVLMQIVRQAPSGVPNIDGYNGVYAGYGVGQLEYVGPLVEQLGLTDQQIYQVINLTRPTSVACFVAFVTKAEARPTS